MKFDRVGLDLLHMRDEVVPKRKGEKGRGRFIRVVPIGLISFDFYRIFTSAQTRTAFDMYSGLAAFCKYLPD